jgi:glycosyltransferase involved in cell wall biosynthesis
MTIAILGTRGIPNRYGGFEAFAEGLATWLVQRGHQVRVYCSSTHPIHDPLFQGVERVMVSDPVALGSASQFVYDLLCIRHWRKHRTDVILQLGYTSSGIWQWLLPSNKLITNMDGLEWKRTKYPPLVRRFLRWSEARAAHRAGVMVADAQAIAHYLRSKYTGPIHTIPYPAPKLLPAAEAPLRWRHLAPGQFGLIVARAEPENHVAEMTAAWLESGTEHPLVVVSNAEQTPHGQQLLRRLGTQPSLHWAGTIYNPAELAWLRCNAGVYLHGHSVGGTNPSLLEALSAGKPIIAHNNPFNQEVMGSTGLFFEKINDLSELLRSFWTHPTEPDYHEILQRYTSEMVYTAYENLMISLLDGQTQPSGQAE